MIFANRRIDATGAESGPHVRLRSSGIEADDRRTIAVRGEERIPLFQKTFLEAACEAEHMRLDSLDADALEVVERGAELVDFGEGQCRIVVPLGARAKLEMMIGSL